MTTATATAPPNGELRTLRVDVNDLIQLTRTQGEKIRQLEDWYGDIGTVDDRVDKLTERVGRIVEKLSLLIGVVNKQETTLVALARQANDKSAKKAPAKRKAVKKQPRRKKA